MSISQFWRSAVQQLWLTSLRGVSRGRNDGAGRAAPLSGEASISKLTQTVGRIQLHGGVELVSISLLAVDQWFSASAGFLHSLSVKPATAGRVLLMR